MKGGGIVLLVIFVFLFICFVWWIASVVGGAREKVQSKSKKIKPFWPPKSEPTSSSNSMPGDFQKKDGSETPIVDEKKIYAPNPGTYSKTQPIAQERFFDRRRIFQV